MKKSINDLVNEYGLNLSQAKVVEARDKELIVPAGAGSGKTKTLVTKVLELLKEGNSLDNFLVLTFTKKAASEMKERIKSELVKANMIDMANKIDSSNISTFDAFAYNFVKQNASLIKLDSNIELLDQSIFNTIKQDMLDEIIVSIMRDREHELYDFIKTFSSKFDELDLKRAILNTYDNLLEVDELDNLNLSGLVLRNNIFDYDDFYQRLEDLSEEFVNEYSDYLNAIKLYFDYLNGFSEELIEISLPRFSWSKLGIIDSVKKQIVKILDEVKELVKETPTKEDLDEYFNIEDKYINDIVLFLKLYETRLETFKKEVNKYEFRDIANFLNQILRENKQVLERQKQRFKYVFVDEYQDTSKVQSDFLEMLIEDNELINVLYVGDIKQSIYKFRNARPDTFLRKQEEVKVISLDTNYRSSSKVIKFVNDLFIEMLNDEKVYDINYKHGHIMESGNTSFNSDINADVYSLELHKEEGARDKNDPVEEAFVIGNKIKELMDNKVIKKYSEVAILARNKASFKIYSDVFNYLNIPIEIQVDQNLKQTYLLKLISNILKLASIIDLNDKNLINDKRFLYYSIARSELFKKSDFELFNSLLDINNPTYKQIVMDNEIYNKLKIINKAIKSKSNFEIIDLIIKEFNIYKLIDKTKKRLEKNYQIEYLYSLSNTLSDLSINSFEFVNYVYEISYDEDVNLMISILEEKDSNSVKVTNIHQSKGLEYEVLFVSGLNRQFNRGLVSTFEFTNNSLFNLNLKGVLNNPKLIVLNDYLRSYKISLNLKDNLKEELRLLYVALTRAERSLYLLTIPKDDYITLNSFTDYLYMNEFYKFIKKENLIKYNSFLKETDYYLSLKEDNLYYDSRIELLEDVSFNIKEEIVESKRASALINNLIKDSDLKNIDSGNKLHLDFEFKNTNNKLVSNLYNKSFNNKNLRDGEVLTEYEFIYENNQKLIRGIIDMLVIYEDEVHIIDYKLRDLSNTNYIDQLNTYKDYIKSVYTNKKIKLFLYSITEGIIKEL